MSTTTLLPEASLDERGRCCGRKPLVYKSHTSTSTGPHRYCPRCDRAYDLEEGYQIQNWAYRKVERGFERQTGTGARCF